MYQGCIKCAFQQLHDVQAFLGFCNFYRRFIHNYLTIARPLFDLAKKDMPFQWGAPQEASFRALIGAFTSAPVLMLPNHNRPFCLITDASDFTLGTIWSNLMNLIDNTLWHTSPSR